MKIKHLIASMLIAGLSTPALSDTVSSAQQMLNKLGYNAGPVDGAYGGKTRRALEAFYSNNVSSYDGVLDENEINDLKIATATTNAVVGPTVERVVSGPRDLPNHKRYSQAIKTPLRDLKVSEEMTLVKDFQRLMAYHAKHTLYKDRENSGMVQFYSQKIEFDQCVPDLARTNTMKGSKGSPNFGAYTNFCHNMIAHQFLVNPKKNVKHYRQIIDYWLENEILLNVNKIQAQMGREAHNYAYALSTNVAKVMAHFAIYHPLYNYDAARMIEVEVMFEKFAQTYNYYAGFKGRGPHLETLCNLKHPTVPRGTNDHCGSFNTRMSVGATLLGIELGNQIIFDKGVQHVEVMLATFDKNKIYTSQIFRHDGLSYADQVNPAIDQLDFAFQKAFGVDFANMKNSHGVTPGEVFQHIWTVANNPSLLLPYMDHKRRQEGGANMYENVSDYDGQDMYDVISDIEGGKRKPEYIWQAFNERRYILSAPALAEEFQPKLWVKWRKKVRFNDYDYGGHITGFSPMIVRNSANGL
jgi:peptidoglycan hydrolase-like protein with peptidoglycan-binding domain